MTPMRDERPPGFAAPIHRGVWEPIVMMGAPRIWSTLWLVFCLWCILLFLTVLGVRWALLPPVAWALGQSVLVLLTQWDPCWVELVGAHLVRRYQSFYDAG